jgi:hypothetical protein
MDTKKAVGLRISFFNPFIVSFGIKSFWLLRLVSGDSGKEKVVEKLNKLKVDCVSD